MTIEVGDIVQLDPDTTINPAFAGCLLVVTTVNVWGVQGYVKVPGDRLNPGGLALYRAFNDSFIRCGRAMWLVEPPFDNGVEVR